MHQPTQRYRVCGLGAGLAVCLTTAAVAVAAAAPTTIGTASNAKLGRILVSAHGRTLYMFSRDSHGRSSCSGSCTDRWIPVLGSRVAAKRGSGVKSALLATSRRSSGNLQATYNGHPLYEFSGDRSAGTTAGEGASEFGGRWYAVNTSGNEVKPKSSSRCDPVCSGY